MSEQMFLIEARRMRRGDQPAGIARSIVTGGSRYAALSKLRVTTIRAHRPANGHADLGIIPIAGAGYACA